VYSGPIGAVLNPGLRGLAAMHTLPFASTLCGACADVCPVRIPIPQLLLEWRTRAVAAGLRPRAETRIMHAFARTAVKPALFQAAGRALAMLPASLRRTLPLLRDWAGQRAPLVPAFRSFLDRWKEPGHSGRPASVDTRAANNANPTDAEPAPPAAAARSPEPDANVAARLQEDTRASVDAHSAGERRVFAGGTRGPATARTPDTPHGREAGAVMRAVREALAGRTRVAHPGALIAADDIAGPASVDASVVDRFMVRFRANGGEVVRFTTLNEALEWLQQVTQDVKGVAVSALVPEALSAFRFGVQPAPPETAALGMSMATGAAAASGTLLLDSRERRAIHLLPPQHIVWLREGLISPTLDQLLEAKRADLPAALGLHSGPSKSADIGRVIVTGVHGPGRVIAAIVP
jgi:L-lactate dehydrogenase complex protein LldG